jgi:signal transduction histidine kinase
MRPSNDTELELLQALRTAVCLVTPALALIRLNRAAEELFGLHNDEVSGRPLADVLPALIGAREAGLVHETLLDSKPRYYRVNHHEGTSHTVWDVCVSRFRGGNVLLFECRPIPDMERELVSRIRESESLRTLARQMAAEPDTSALLRMLTEAAQRQCEADAAIVVQIQGAENELIAASGRLERLRGLRVPFSGSLSQRVSETHELVSEPAFSTRHSALQTLIPEFHMGPVVMTPLIAHDQQLGVLGIAREEGAAPFLGMHIQRLKVIADYAALVLWKSRLLEQAQAANEAKASFLATMSHELRTPITALTGYGELLADAEILGSLTEQQADVVERMRSVTHHLSVMIEEVLAFASLEAGREVVRMRESAAGEILRAVCAVAEPLARQKSLELRTSIPPEPVVIFTDDDKVRQVLVNLLGNAVKFTDRGSVMLSLREEPEFVVFEVTDTGIGIAEADMPRLFHPFTQLDSGLTRRHGGTGLGLYISQRLAALLGGRIDIRSKPGQGSTFMLRLPHGKRGE